MTRLLEWHENWSSGLERLDIQHIELADCFNRVSEACRNFDSHIDRGSSTLSADLNELFDGLFQRIRAHFKYEERTMLEFNYPGVTAHKREHVMLLAELKSILTAEQSSADAEKKLEILGDLKTWLIAHANHSDSAFSTYIKKLKSKSNNVAE